MNSVTISTEEYKRLVESARLLKQFRNRNLIKIVRLYTLRTWSSDKELVDEQDLHAKLLYENKELAGRVRVLENCLELNKKTLENLEKELNKEPDKKEIKKWWKF